ncbi:UBN2 domain-containing protein [Cephalotus follicularis]|uniref:UBN2 domain-containing protein n=1 Tax=Cephalotus follicularis TaxID=3775 RepID=A0A1Q3APG8_CEPFO|nr:UBN2 domain-containing protein [Cephalotus follicularis]
MCAYTVSGDTLFALIVLILYIVNFIVTFSVNNNMITIEVLTGSNFKKWKEDIEFAIEMADVDLSLVSDKPGDLTVSSTEDEKLVHVAWMKSNRICLLSMRRSILDHMKSGLPTDCTAKELMTAINERYRVSSHADIGSLFQILFNMKYDGNGGIIRMVDYQTKLKALKVDLPDTCIVHQALNTLPPEFSIIKTNYNSQDESWSINDLISRVVAEEEKLKKEKGQVALYAAGSNSLKGKKPKTHTNKVAQRTTKEPSPSKNMGPNKFSFKKKGDHCFFCKKKCHIKKDCQKYKAWLAKHEKEGNDSLAFVCESNLSEVPSSSWWLDSSSTNHVAFTGGSQIRMSQSSQLKTIKK